MPHPDAAGPRVYLPAEPGVYVVEVDGALYLVDDRLSAWRRRRPYRGDRAALRLVGGRAARTLLERLGVVAVAGPRGATSLLAGPPIPDGPRLRLLPPGAAPTEEDAWGLVVAAQDSLDAALRAVAAARAAFVVAEDRFRDWTEERRRRTAARRADPPA